MKHTEQFQKVAYLVSLTNRDTTKQAGLGTYVGKHVANAGAKGIKALAGKFKPDAAPNVNLITDTVTGMMGPKAHSMLGRGALGAGALAATPVATGMIGHGMGHRSGYNSGGLEALGQAQGALQDNYGGWQGRLNALLGGARPGNDAILQIAQQYGFNG